MKAPTAHELAHKTATLKHRNKVIGTANAQHLDLKNVKYTIAFNKDKSRAWYFFNSGRLFFKWETNHQEPEVVEAGFSAYKQTFIPKEIKP